MSYDPQTVVYIALIHGLVPYEDRVDTELELRRLGPDSPRLRELLEPVALYLDVKAMSAEIAVKELRDG